MYLVIFIIKQSLMLVVLFSISLEQVSGFSENLLKKPLEEVVSSTTTGWRQWNYSYTRKGRCHGYFC